MLYFWTLWTRRNARIVKNFIYALWVLKNSAVSINLCELQHFFCDSSQILNKQKINLEENLTAGENSFAERLWIIYVQNYFLLNCMSSWKTIWVLFLSIELSDERDGWEILLYPLRPNILYFYQNVNLQNCAYNLLSWISSL